MVKEDRETCEFTLDGKELPGKEILAVLDRNPMEYSNDYSNMQKKNESDYIFLEWRNVLISLCYYLPVSLVVSPPHKAYPLFRTAMIAHARELGLKVPFTVISNWPQSIKKHLFNSKNSSGKITVQSASYHPKKFPAYMSEMTEEEFDKVADSYREFPSIWRRREVQKYDVRVYAIGNKLIGVKIDSQANEETKVDWKANPEYDMYEPYEVAKEFGEKINNFQKLIGLNFAAYDFTVVDESKDPLFLEIDKHPNWRFIETRTNINISEELLSMLEVGKEK